MFIISGNDKMYYRRKILLALIQSFGGRVTNTDFQKYLFLLNRLTSRVYYNFVPYKYGCFSFQSYSDKRALMKTNVLEDNDDAWVVNDDIDYISYLSNPDRNALKIMKQSYSLLKGDELIKYIYREYPYFATRSELVEKLLSSEEIERVNEHRNSERSLKLFTLGYENRDVDEFINVLLLNNIRLLCDVRKNPVSMKYGFSKNQIKSTCMKFDIEYVHIPELGIESEKRKTAAIDGDYEHLFNDYLDDVSQNRLEYVVMVLNLLSEYKRIALVCFEYNPSDCHRSRIVQVASNLSGNNLNVANL